MLRKRVWRRKEPKEEPLGKKEEENRQFGRVRFRAGDDPESSEVPRYGSHQGLGGSQQGVPTAVHDPRARPTQTGAGAEREGGDRDRAGSKQALPSANGAQGALAERLGTRECDVENFFRFF